MAIRLGGTVGGTNYVGSTLWEPMANVPRIDSIDGDDIVTDGQTGFLVEVANFSGVDRVTVTAGGQTQEWVIQ